MKRFTPKRVPALAVNALDVLGWMGAVLNFINLLIGTIENILGFGEA